MTKLSIIIPSLNSPCLYQCLDSLWNKEQKLWIEKNQDQKNQGQKNQGQDLVCEIIIIQDIPSQDRIIYLIEQTKRRIGAPIVVVNNEQIGVPKAFNQGIRLALEHGADYVALINDDIIFQTDNMLYTIINILKNHHEYGYISPIVDRESRYINGNINEYFAGIAECSIHTRESFEKAGLLDEGIEFHKLGTDGDYWCKLLAAGYKPHGIQLVVKHLVGQTIKSNLTIEDCICVDQALIRRWGNNGPWRLDQHLLPCHT